MIEYKYNKALNKFTENGHTMFKEDVLKRLKRLAYLEEQIKNKLEAPPICSCGSNDYYTEVYKDVTKYYCKKCHKKIK